MKQEETVLLLLLQAGLKNEKLTVETLGLLKEESLSEVLSLSADHSVTTIVAEALLSNGLLDNSNLKAVYEENLMLSVYQYHQQQMELIRVCRLFEENGIYHIPLKGSVLRKLYREPWLRTCCDVDILVKPEQLDVAKELLLACGYMLNKHYSHDVSFFTEGNMRVELHFDLIEEDHDIGYVSEVLKDVWQYARPVEGYIYTCQLDKELFYFYHIAHMVKHFVGGGCGIRSVIDAWLMQRHWDFDTEKLDMLLQKGGIFVFERKVRELIATWWENETPSEVTKLIEQYIFRGGVYGSQQNLIAMEQIKNGSKWRNALSKIFVKYSVLKYHYPVLQKHKWFLPFYEVKRWCKLIFGKEHRERSLTYLKENQSVSQARTEESMALLLALGLKTEGDTK